VDFVRRWSEKAEIGVGRFIPWLGVTASEFYDWRQRVRVRQRNSPVTSLLRRDAATQAAVCGIEVHFPVDHIGP